MEEDDKHYESIKDIHIKMPESSEDYSEINKKEL